ncbi:glycoside hydrolase [Coccomyxa subellipsoidea C-169]|uniref:mannan endo-1,4-beta-mannosidase n=1 Tax=Coccomyxa subellipsoidea (strain C-169) TaxID=574566 RepID=I0ZAS3_COCSC|nr:glycoside hydrolase [Coccomyxa subellipsoidea C-169]EIE27742.1 glycoside hydrolase [Coccomyxa subellipsoidea C-169]|eukprot:XP_005652286.1 glycoside hydrolase [Coccomyxa subellipsoidea C-169]
MNEPRSAKSNGAQEIQSWITEVAPYVKSLAPNQLVTVGEDGFYQASNCQAASANPSNSGGGGAWPLQTGQDFLPNHLVDGIDFASIHMWPDNWDRTDQAFGRAWLDAHMKDAWYLGKPVVIEEFGKAQGGWMAAATETYANQYSYFKLTYDYALGSVTSGYGYKGIMFWRWASVDAAANNGGFDEAATICALLCLSLL